MDPVNSGTQDQPGQLQRKQLKYPLLKHAEVGMSRWLNWYMLIVQAQRLSSDAQHPFFKKLGAEVYSISVLGVDSRILGSCWAASLT